MNASEAHGHLLASTRRLLESLTAPPLAPFLAEWPRPESLFTSDAAGVRRASRRRRPRCRCCIGCLGSPALRMFAMRS